MMVGSDCSRMFFLSRFWNTLAISGRSSARPVSLSTLHTRINASSLLLHDGCEDQGLFRRRHHNTFVAGFPYFGEELRLRGLHPLDDVLARVVAAEPIGIGEQAAFRSEE